jgi:opacity protein-like surface antigen
MKKYLLVSLMCFIATNSAIAEESNGVELEDFSVGAGFGFHANDDTDGFLINFGPAYHIDENWSAGVDMQFGFEDDTLLFSMPFYGQYDTDNFATDMDILKDMHAFVKLGLGFTYAEFDPSGSIDDFDDTGFLFVIGGGVAYDLNEHISIESRMQFNITTNDFFDDDFYFSWEVLAARYRF